MRTQIVPPEEVRAQFQRVKPLKDIAIQERGWALDVLNLVRRLVDRSSRGNEAHTGKTGTSQGSLTSSPTTEFTNADIYAHARELESLHPDNRHIRDKIRQQLQVLRDAKLLVHLEPGVWRLP
jgi:type II restriction enzyme